MTKNEFNDWFGYHSARFLGISAFLDTKKDPKGAPMGQQILDQGIHESGHGTGKGQTPILHRRG